MYTFESRHDGRHCGEDGPQREAQPFHTATAMFVPDMVETCPLDRIAFVRVVELGTVIGDEDVVTSPPRVREHQSILLARPAKLCHVVDLVSRQDVAQYVEKLNWRVLVEEEADQAARDAAS